MILSERPGLDGFPEDPFVMYRIEISNHRGPPSWSDTWKLQILTDVVGEFTSSRADN